MKLHLNFRGFLLVILSPSQNSDCSSRHQTFGATNFPCQKQKFKTYLHNSVIRQFLSESTGIYLNLIRGIKNTIKQRKTPISEDKCLCLLYPNATILKTSANNATVSQRPTTVRYCEKPFPVSANASAPAAPALP